MSLPVFVVVSGLPIFVVISVLPVCVDDKEVLYLDLTIKFYAVIILVMMRLAAAGTTAAGAEEVVAVTIVGGASFRVVVLPSASVMWTSVVGRWTIIAAAGATE